MDYDIIFGELLSKCEKYTENPEYVFKTCYNTTEKKGRRSWLVILQKLKTTITDENRDDVFDEKFTSFRANELKVIKIISTYKPTLVKKSVTNIFNDIKKEYIVDKIVKEKKFVPNSKKSNITNSNAPGIYYFKTLEAAYCYRDIPHNFSGKLIMRYQDGRKLLDGDYINGIPNGDWKIWRENGVKRAEGKYKNGEKYGRWIEWTHDKKISFDGNYDIQRDDIYNDDKYTL